MRSVRRVLVHHPFGIGDLLFLTPVLRALWLVPTVERVDLLLGSRTEELISTNPHVDKIYTIDKDELHDIGKLKTVQSSARLLRELRQNRYDLLIDYSSRLEWGLLGGVMLGIPRRAGFNYKNRGLFHNFKLQIPHGFDQRHAVDYYADLAETAGIAVEHRFPEVYLTDEDRSLAKTAVESAGTGWNEKWLVVSPGGGASWGKDADFKQWPVTSFAGLIRQLRERIDFQKVVILGSAGERDLAEKLKNNLLIPAMNFAGSLAIRTAAALIERSVCVAANDGGLVHIAHALRRPVIAVYGPVDPKVYGPYPDSRRAVSVFHSNLECRPCYQNFRYNSGCVGRECLQDLSADEVIKQMEQSGFFETTESFVH